MARTAPLKFCWPAFFRECPGSSPDYSNINSFSLGGGRPAGNPIIIDGLPSNMGADDTCGLIPTPESTEEFQVLTAPFSAQYGQTGGAAEKQTFFFTDWEDTQNPSGTQAGLSGNFSGPTPQRTAPVTIYDPNTTAVVNGKVTRQAFPGNIIPANRIDPVGAKIASFYPGPNCQLATFNYCVAPKQSHSYLYNADRIDQNISDADRLWFKFSRDGPTTGAVITIPNAANPNAPGGWTDDHSEATWNHIFSPNIANEFRVALWKSGTSARHSLRMCRRSRTCR